MTREVEEESDNDRISMIGHIKRDDINGLEYRKEIN